MSAFVFWVAVLVALVSVAGALYRAMQDERAAAMAAEPVALPARCCWLCAGRLTTAAHYVGGDRVVCADCFDASRAVLT